jgi:hypothetical protein
MPATLLLPEILDSIKASAKNENDIVRGLQVNNTSAIRELLRYAFDRREWYRGETPPFSSDGSPDGLSPTSIYIEIKRFYIFKKEYKLPTKRKDEILIQILESISPKEAEMVESLLNGKFSDRYEISLEIALKAFPNLYSSNTPISL